SFRGYGGDAQVYLSWTAVPGAAMYSIKWSTTPGGPYAPHLQTGEVSDVDLGLSNNVTYYYVISALNSDGESIDSPETSATPRQGGSCASMSPVFLVMTGLLSLARRARGKIRRRRWIPQAAAA